MKRILSILIAFSGLALISCNDSFLEIAPETYITEENFFQTAEDLELYSYNFYDYFYPSTEETYLKDAPSDNTVNDNRTFSIYNYMSGGTTPSTVSQWSWGNIREVNYMIARCGQVESSDDANHYIGFARMCRAKLYYEKVWSYSDVPWYSKDISTDETDLLYKSQDPRELVCDSILADLDYAIENMYSSSNLTNKSVFSKDAALAIKARICLYEASWRKYHSELGLTSSADEWYEEAIDACEELMSMGYSLDSDYAGVFCNAGLTSSKEVILYRDFDSSYAIYWCNNDCFYAGDVGLSNDLLQEYLNADGTRYTDLEDCETRTVVERFTDRDPRLKATFIYPGWCRPITATQYYINNLYKPGYECLKWEPMYDYGNCYSYGSGSYCWGDIPLYRYAETLLIYAEAKAELGTLTQSDLDDSINLIRARAGMPDATLSDWLSDIDPILEDEYTNVSGTQKGAILEIRRERRVEMAAEYVRYEDMFRWALGEKFLDLHKGVYVGTELPALIDFTGDGNYDVAICSTSSEASTYSEQGLETYLSDGDGFDITDDGYLVSETDMSLYSWETKMYYTPISTSDIVENPNLYQNPLWE